MMEKHIVWSGELYHKKSEHIDHQVEPVSLWAVLMRESVFGPKRLELYRNYMDYSNKLRPILVCDLSAMLHVERVLETDGLLAGGRGESPLLSPRAVDLGSSRRWNVGSSSLRSSSTRRQQHHFTITTEKEVHLFAARTGDESSFWVGKLNELLHGPPERGVKYEFPIKVLPTSLSRAFALRSSHLLRVSESEIKIYDARGAVPTAFVCPLTKINKVTVSEESGSKIISIQCINFHGTTGMMSFSTNSSADISRIINHRRLSPTHDHSERPDSLHLQKPTPQPRKQRQSSSTSQLNDTSADSATNRSPTPHTRPQCLAPADPQNGKSTKHDLPSSSSPGDLRQKPPIPRRRQRGDPHCAPNVHASIAMASPVIGGNSPRDRRSTTGDIQESCSNSEDDATSRKTSGGDFESLSSWFTKDDNGSGDFNGSQFDPGQAQVRQPNRQLRRPLSVELRRSRPTQASRLNRFSSAGSSIDEEDGAPDSLSESIVLNESYELYDIRSWRTRPVATNMNGVRQQAHTPGYESILELALEKPHEYEHIDEFTDQPQSLPDYEDIKEGNYCQSGKLPEVMERTSPQIQQQKSVSDYEDIDESVVCPDNQLGESDDGERERLPDPPDYEDILEEGYSLACGSLKSAVEEEREEGGEREPKDDGTTPDYDYVKFRILGVRGIPGQQPKPHSPNREPTDSDDEEHYYY